MMDFQRFIIPQNGVKVNDETVYDPHWSKKSLQLLKK